jgi:hypothetical protein
VLVAVAVVSTVNIVDDVSAAGVICVVVVQILFFLLLLPLFLDVVLIVTFDFVLAVVIFNMKLLLSYCCSSYCSS